MPFIKKTSIRALGYHHVIKILMSFHLGETCYWILHSKGFSQRGEWSSSNFINWENRGGLDLSIYARNFEANFGILIRNALEVDHQKPVKLFPCTYIKKITGQLPLD